MPAGSTERFFKLLNITHVFSEVFVEEEHGAVFREHGTFGRKVHAESFSPVAESLLVEG